MGLVIDNAIVVVDNIVLHRDSGESRGEAIRRALKEISAPLLGSTITPIVVFLPLVTITGVMGTCSFRRPRDHPGRGAFADVARPLHSRGRRR